jgi:Ferredoxin
MPTVQFRGEEIECREGAVLRDVLLEADLTPHNGIANVLNCHGFASCGTCAVRVEGEVSDVGVREKARLLVPPHHPNYRLRLACQTRVEGDIKVEKYPGMWGTDLASEPLPPVADDEADEGVSADSSAADADTETPQNAD